MTTHLSDHDKELFAKFQKLIPSDSDTIDFIHHHSWADSCQNLTLKPFYLLRNTWKSASFDFDNQEINMCFHLLKNANQDFLFAVGKYIGPHNDCPGWYSINYDDTNPTAKQLLALQTLDELSRKWYCAHGEFIEVFRSESARSESARSEGPASITPQTQKVFDTRIIHSLSADVQEGWLGNFCDDEYTPILRLATLSHRSLYHVLAWEKTKEFQDGVSRKYELTLYIAKDNISAMQTYTSQSKIYLVRIDYSLGLLKDIAIHKIFANKIVGNLICGKDKEETETECQTIKDSEIREITLAERNRLKELFPQLFAQDVTQTVASENQPSKAGQPVPAEEIVRRVAQITKNMHHEPIRACAEYFIYATDRWDRKRQLCLGIEYDRNITEDAWLYNYKLLLTSLPISRVNQIVLELSVNVPTSDDTSSSCFCTPGHPSKFDGINELVDSMGAKWKVTNWCEREQLSSKEAALFDSAFLGLENNICTICGWIHTADCSRWEHPNTHEVVTTSKKRAKLLFKLHSGMEKDCGDTAIDNFIEDEDRKAGYQAGDILGDKLQTLLYFSTKRGRGRIRKPDEKAPQGRPSKKKK